MKKILPLIVALSTFLTPLLLRAQTFTVNDTVYFTIATAGNVPDTINNHTSAPLALKWRVSSTNFPPEWLTASALGICDDNVCRYNTTTPPPILWDPTADTGALYLSALSLNLASGRSGTYYLTVGIFDPVPLGTSKTMTFIVTKPAGAGVPFVAPNTNDVILYPNPANSELNVVYDEASDVKNIAVYNIIGKVMAVYKVTGNSANLNLDNIPAGIYFVRLYNSTGNIVVTRKFTKQ